MKVIMMKIKIKNFIKSHPFFYQIYYYIASFIVRILAFFVKVDDKKILFVSYGGKKFDDSPKVIYEALKRDDKLKDFSFTWAFIDPDKYQNMPQEEKVKIDTFSYYIKALKSKYWISNASIQRGLNFKSKRHKNILFMHGLTALKKSSKDFKSIGKQFKMVKPEKFDKVFIEGKKERKFVLENIDVDEKNLYNYGLPRCDELLGIANNDKLLEEIKRKLNIPLGKKVILYAPTYREYNALRFSGIHTKPQLDLEKWQESLGENYVLLITSHYEIGNKFDFTYNKDFAFDVADYNSMNELLAISDILVTDYSNIVFDFSILKRPFFCYGYDYSEYVKKGRGFYTPLSEIYKDGIIEEEDLLLEKIKTSDLEKLKEHSKNICNEFILHYGDATLRCIEEILK